MTVLANLIIPDIHSQLGKVSTYQFAAHFTYWALSFRDAGPDNIWPTPLRNKIEKQPKCMQIYSKCTYISDAGFYSLLWHNMQKPLYLCLVAAKEANVQKKTKTMHCCGECKGKGTANHFKIELKPTSSPRQKCSHKRWRNKLNCEFVNFSTVYLYIIPFWFLCQTALVRPCCCDMMQSSLVNHQKPWFQQEDQTGKLLSTTGSLGITNTCTKPAPYIIIWIIWYYTNFQSSTMLSRPEVLQWFFSF